MNEEILYDAFQDIKTLVNNTKNGTALEKEIALKQILEIAESAIKEIDSEVEYCEVCGDSWSGTSCGFDDCGWKQQ